MSAAEQLPELDAEDAREAAEDARREALGRKLSRACRGIVEALGVGSWRAPGAFGGVRADEVLACSSSAVRQRAIDELHPKMRVLGVRTVGGESWVWLALRAAGEAVPPLAPRLCRQGPHLHSGPTSLCRMCLDALKARATARRGRPPGPSGFASMSADRLRLVSQRGGATSAARGHSQRVGFTSATAQAANRIKGRHRFTSSEASEAGKLGAEASAEARAERRAAIGIEARER